MTDPFFDGKRQRGHSRVAALDVRPHRSHRRRPPFLQRRDK